MPGPCGLGFDPPDLSGLTSARRFYDVELDLFARFQCPDDCILSRRRNFPFGGNAAVMDKDVGRAVIRHYEPESLARFEPPNCTCHMVVCLALGWMG